MVEEVAEIIMFSELFFNNYVYFNNDKNPFINLYLVVLSLVVLSLVVLSLVVLSF